MGAFILLAALPAPAADGPLSQCNIKGESSCVAIAKKAGSQYKSFDSDEAGYTTVTAVALPGAPATVNIDCSPDYSGLRARTGASVDAYVSVAGAEWQGRPDDKYHHSNWILPVQPGWNTATIQVECQSSGRSLGTLTQSIRFFAYVFEIEPAGQLQNPLGGPIAFVDDLITDRAGRLYALIRCHSGAAEGKGEIALVRYSASGNLEARYDINPRWSAEPWAVDEDGNLYAYIMDGLVEFDPSGRFKRHVATFGEHPTTITAENLRTGDSPSSQYDKKQREEALTRIRPCASADERAILDDKIYFIAELAPSRACGEHHVLACVTLDGRAAVLDDVPALTGPVLGPGGKLHLIDRDPAGKQFGLVSFDPSGRRDGRIPFPHSTYACQGSISGFDGAGFCYNGDRVYEPDLKQKESADLGYTRFLSENPARGPIVYRDRLTGATLPRDLDRRVLRHWMYRSSLFCVYESDLRIARFTSRAPGAANAPLPVALKRGGRATAQPGGASTAGVPGGGDAAIAPPPGVESPSDDGDTSPVSTATAAVATVLGGLLATLGSWFMVSGSGVTPREIAATLGGLFGGGSEAPVAVPPPPPPPPLHRDGDVNERGEVWSAEEVGWVSRDLHEQEVARRRWLDDKAVADLHAGPSEDVRAAHQQWLASRQQLAEVRAEGRKIEQREALREWVGQREREAQDQSYWSDVRNNFLLNLDREFTDLPKDTFDLCQQAARTVRDASRQVGGVLSDMANWEIVRATGAETLHQLAAHPLTSAGRVLDTVNNAGRAVVRTAATAIAHPIETAKALTGYESWAHALDPSIPLPKRIGYALLGTVDTATMIHGAAAKLGGAASKLAEGADAARAAAGLDHAGDAARLAAGGAERQAAWELGENLAEGRVSAFKNCTTPEELKAATLQVQGDRRAIQMINREPPNVRQAFNREMKAIYSETDAAVEQRLHTALAEKGVDMERYELRASHATNQTRDPFKVGADRDITYSLYDRATGQWVRDVPASHVQPVYNDELYRAVHGAPPSSIEEANALARSLDQQCVDALHPEAYGRNPADLKVVLGEPAAALNDPTQIGKAIGYKAHEWYGRADEALAAGRSVEAEQFLGEGFRQTAKQFDNQLVQRHGALRDLGAAGLKEIPDRLRTGVDIMRSAQRGVPPVAIEQQLRALGYTPHELSTAVGEFVEAMDKLRP